MKFLQRSEQIHQLHNLTIATSAGMGSKEAHKQIQDMTREVQAELSPTEQSGPSAAIPLLEAFDLVDR